MATSTGYDPLARCEPITSQAIAHTNPLNSLAIAVVIFP
jgi:hypothetical protein